MPNLTTIAKWAESIGISRQQGYAAVKRCEIPVTDGQVDTEYASILYERHTRPRANGKRPAPLEKASLPQREREGETARVPSYDASRARQAAADASLAEMKEAEARGKYLLKADVEAAIYQVARALRDGLMNCSRRVGADVAALSDADACEALIASEHRALLESMQHTLATSLALEPAEEAAQ
ncbi:hypothetical protein [Janthinobacterium sp. 75]|uniref:hypothetical protein n=1 Tax=Janthinobacterium sp. 75 TaxID=2135628 RepID=UPI001062D93E|nr:hypothetical protein [Janthinobacterium sp. 75]TDY35099.1 hypothetical protein C8C89_2946 [Janthinobacterium sp. 75]